MMPLPAIISARIFNLNNVQGNTSNNYEGYESLNDWRESSVFLLYAEVKVSCWHDYGEKSGLVCDFSSFHYHLHELLIKIM